MLLSRESQGKAGRLEPTQYDIHTVEYYQEKLETLYITNTNPVLMQ